VAGVVSASVTGHNGKVFREDIDNLAFALVAPLRAYDDRSFALLQMQSPWNLIGAAAPAAIAGSHTLVARDEPTSR
jgi:hypothetical protein